MKYCPAQICLNGHVITENANIPRNRKEICPICKEQTITECPNCKEIILGMAINGNAYGFYDKNKPPSHCHKCKEPYPWAST